MGVGGFKCKKSVRKKGGGGSRVLKKVYDFIWTAPYPNQRLLLSPTPTSPSALTLLFFFKIL